MRVPIVSGTVTAPSGAFLNSYPTNREPVLKETGLAEGYLSRPPGIVTRATPGLGKDRGGIAWNGKCFRVLGTTLVSISSRWFVTKLGDVGYGDVCGFDYSFDNLMINSGDRLYYWNPKDGLRQVTDNDLGDVVDEAYVDGYTMTTDGEFLVVTELNDPMAVNPLKYGSAEESPDAITGLEHMHGEVYVLNRYTIQVFQNVGGTGFPFRTIKSATIPKGCVGPRAKVQYAGTIAFVGGPDGCEPGVYLVGAGDADKISSQEVDDALAALPEGDLALVHVEARMVNDDERLFVHLPDHSWGFSMQVTRKSSVKTWCRYVSGSTMLARYEGRGAVYAYNKWIVGSSLGEIGTLEDDEPQHFGRDVCWQFETTFFYNEARRGLITGIELIGTPGRGKSDARVFFSYTKDGNQWSMERATSAGRPGQHNKHVAWRPGLRMENWLGLRFRGLDGSLMAITRLECDVEAMD